MTNWRKYPDENPEEEGYYLVFHEKLPLMFGCCVREWINDSWSARFNRDMDPTHFSDIIEPPVEPPEFIEEPTDISEVKRGKHYKVITMTEPLPKELTEYYSNKLLKKEKYVPRRFKRYKDYYFK